jgi:hypothetical protein
VKVQEVRNEAANLLKILKVTPHRPQMLRKRGVLTCSCGRVQEWKWASVGGSGNISRAGRTREGQGVTKEDEM